MPKINRYKKNLMGKWFNSLPEKCFKIDGNNIICKTCDKKVKLKLLGLCKPIFKFFENLKICSSKYLFAVSLIVKLKVRSNVLNILDYLRKKIPITAAYCHCTSQKVKSIQQQQRRKCTYF